MLVSTGCGAVDCLETGVVTEVFDLMDPTTICDPLDDFPIQTSQGTGGLLDDKYPLICAGVYSNQCYIIGEDHATATLQTERRYSSSLLMDPKALWITGGLTPGDGIFDQALSSTELISLSEDSRFGPELPVHVWGHCIARMYVNSAMLIGGVSKEYYSSSKTFIFDYASSGWTEGLDMNRDR